MRLRIVHLVAIAHALGRLLQCTIPVIFLYLISSRPPCVHFHPGRSELAAHIQASSASELKSKLCKSSITVAFVVLHRAESRFR